MSKPKPKIAAQGFSLIEVMFTLLFFTVIVLGAAKLQTSNLALSHTQNLTLQAHYWASNALEAVEAIGEGGITCTTGPCTVYLRASGGSFSLVTPAVAADADRLINNLFTRTLEVYPLGISAGAIARNPTTPNAFEVTALLEWEDSTGEHRRLNAAGETMNAHVEAKRIIYD